MVDGASGRVELLPEEPQRLESGVRLSIVYPGDSPTVRSVYRYCCPLYPKLNEQSVKGFCDLMWWCAIIMACCSAGPRSISQVFGSGRNIMARMTMLLMAALGVMPAGNTCPVDSKLYDVDTMNAPLGVARRSKSAISVPLPKAPGVYRWIND